MLDFCPLYEMVGTSADGGRLRPAEICFNDHTVGHGDPSSYQVIENFEKFFLKKFNCLKMFEKCRTKDGT